jgi:hypothetical protein
MNWITQNAWFDFQLRKHIFIFSKASRQAMGPVQSLIELIPGTLFPEVTSRVVRPNKHPI